MTTEVGCIGKCTVGLTTAELNLITEDVSKALDHPKGIELFEKFLERTQRRSDLACLEMYRLCSDIESSSTGNTDLIDEIDRILQVARMRRIQAVDFPLQRELWQARSSPSKNDKLSVIAKTKYQVMKRLEGAHDDFRKYAPRPCPRSN